ncbi:tetratricopeptide repeat protein [Leadbettera azotonutricia]|uniref:Tetratricopeptide repeat protein n=1 Tax=Leadbettera azotonutricia (strain ATCC BAA-888 / DSM 13862 / ZAS-9) TaxID=545695 RepID=F5YCB4_LEAAZ|nr:tetratricopeptide repeat protein [Leadbettera azotonutricia]AEF83280.1 tetratricopeptide repeat protein [Leadbettera azotonutricia ZAS-9]
MAEAEGKGGPPPRKAGQGGAIKEGVRLYRLKRWDLALQELLLVNAEKFSPEENTELAYYLGLCYTKLERFDDALLYLEQVVTSGQDPLRVYQCRMTLAYIYVLTKRSKMAEFELHRLANNGFESAQLYATLAFAAWTQKHYKQAVDYYEKALDLDENNTTALNGLGYVLVDSDIDPLRGLRCCKKAVDLKPQSAAYLDSLGWAYFKNGELIEARTWLRRAIEAAPQQKEIKDHLRVVTGEV